MFRRTSYIVAFGACIAISSCNGLFAIEAPEDKVRDEAGPSVDASGPEATAYDVSVEASTPDAASDASTLDASASDAREASTTDVSVNSEGGDVHPVPDAASCDGGLTRCPDGCFDTTRDPDHCHDCVTKCSPIARAVVTCSSGECKSYTLTTAQGRQSPLLGYDSGAAFNMLCPPNEIVVGIEGVGADLDASTPFDTVWGIAAHCAHLGLRRTTTGYAVDVIPDPTALPLQGGFIAPPPPRFIFNCPQSPEPTIVSEVSGSLGTPGSYTEDLNVISVACSTVRVDASLHVTVDSPIVNQTIGVSQGHIEDFSNTCDPGAAVNGFTGRSGAFIDAFSVSCATLSVTLR